MNFYAISSCDYAPGNFYHPLLSVLTLTTDEPTKAVKIPAGTKWLIAEASYHATAVRWSAG